MKNVNVVRCYQLADKIRLIVLETVAFALCVNSGSRFFTDNVISSIDYNICTCYFFLSLPFFWLAVQSSSLGFICSGVS